MADQANIFSGNNSEATPPQPGAGTPNSDAGLLTMLQSIKNENGEPKYKTLEDAITALKHSQEYIPQLKTTLAQREAELERARSEAERIAELERSLAALANPPAKTDTPSGAVVDESRIADLVEQTLTRRQVEAKRAENTSTVVAALQEAYGDQAEKVFYEKAQTLGFSRQEINDLAAKSPKAVLELVGVKTEQKQNSSIIPPTQNSGGLTPPGKSQIRRNENSILIGATTGEVIQESRASRAMVDELHSKGLSISDLTNPKEYFKHFG